jgi:pimeloyl-ACP methyl ester carboxylesterase
MMQMVEEHFAAVGGRRVRYLEAGGGWPVLLLHAFPMNADQWRPQLERAPAGWRLVAPDVVARPGAERVEAMAADVLELADHLEIERAVIGGLSMGGYLTFAAYQQAPERFVGMLLANTRSAADTPDGRIGRERMIALVRDRGTSAIVDEMLPKLLGATARRDRPDLQAEVRRIAESCSPEGVAGALAAMRDRPDSTPTLERISCTTLVIGADEDVVTPLAEMERMQERIPRSRFVVLRGAGHLSNLEVADQFSRALTDFFASRM